MNKRKFARIALFIIFGWFGILKVLKLSPATALVLALLDKTLPFLDPTTFLIVFGLFEVMIGILFLLPRFKKITLILFALHMVCTILPLLLLPHMAWQQPLVPTLEGQYIIKNIALIALTLFI